jgi:hypothetical protein
MFGSNFRFGGMPQGGGMAGGAGRSAGMFPQRPQMAGQAVPQRIAGGGFGQMGQRTQMAPRPGGPSMPFGMPQRPGGFQAQAGGAMQRAAGNPYAAAPRPGGMAGNVSGMMGAAGGMLSDEQSKQKIQELEDELSKTYAALGGKSATGDVQPSDHGEGLDEAFRKPSSNSYEYKDPTAPGAAPGRQVGPMADELKGLPGVVSPGADGLDRVNTPRLTLANTSELANLRREMDALMGKIGTGGSNPDGTF